MPENRGKGAGLPKDPDVKTVGNDPEKRWRGGKGGAERIEERVNACYNYILEGGTRRQITERLSSRFGTSLSHLRYRLFKSTKAAERGTTLKHVNIY